MDLIDYAEQQGLANYQWQARVNDTTRQEANVTLGFLLAGGGASLGWGISRIGGTGTDPALITAVLAMACWLFALAAGVLFKCLAFRPAMPPANHPLHVYLPQFNSQSIREQQLEHLEQAILHSIANGQQKAKALVKLRLAACFTPLVFLAAWALAAWCFPR